MSASFIWDREFRSLTFVGTSPRSSIRSADSELSLLLHCSQIFMQPGSKRILVLITGWSFLLFGLVGLFLPFLQGLLFMLIGIIILSSQYAWARLLPSGPGGGQGQDFVEARFSPR